MSGAHQRAVAKALLGTEGWSTTASLAQRLGWEPLRVAVVLHTLRVRLLIATRPSKRRESEHMVLDRHALLTFAAERDLRRKTLQSEGSDR